MSAQERTGWRDLGLSRRHRTWGVGVPAVDMDLFLEYDWGQPRAIIEYVCEGGRKRIDDDWNLKALRNLADRADIFFFVVGYSKDFHRWRIVPGNKAAAAKLANMPKGRTVPGIATADNPAGVYCREDDYRWFLHWLRDKREA